MGHRCSDLGFLPISVRDYMQLLDWTARQLVPGKHGRTPEAAPPILNRLSLSGPAWFQLVGNFGRMFFNVAGKPQVIDNCTSRVTARRFHMSRAAREILSPAA